MKRFVLVVLFCGVFATGAIVITPFYRMDNFLKNGKHIVVADCLSLLSNRVFIVDGREVTEEFRDGLHAFEVNVVRTLKGDKGLGKLKVVTIYNMAPRRRYFLYSLDGCAGYDTDFFAVPELSVVEVSPRFDLRTLDGKSLKEQVSLLFADHLAQLQEEERLLRKALQN